jgi:4-amino-4-deoxy-L-arabinose transferase-like glycosyltransferase
MRIRLLWSPWEGLWSPLDPDAQTYRQEAVEILTRGVSGIVTPRGPLFSIVVAIFFALFGESNIVPKLTSFLFGILTIIMTYKVSKEEFGRDAGIMSSFLVATSYYVVFDSLRALREELFSFVLLCMIYFALTKRGNSKYDLAYTAVATGLLYFTRSEGAIFAVLPLLAYVILSARPTSKAVQFKLVAILAGFVASIAGWALIQTKAFGDPFMESTQSATMFYWGEFQHGAGSPMLKVSMMEYLFKYHTPDQLLLSSAKGTVWIIQFLEMTFFPYWFGYPPSSSPLALLLFPVLPILFLSGAIILLKQKRNWYFPLPYLVVVPYLGLLHQFGVIETGRYLVPFAPLFVITITYPLILLCRSLKTHLERLSWVEAIPTYGFSAFLLSGYICISYSYLLAWANIKEDLTDLLVLGSLTWLVIMWFILTILRK